MVSPSIDSGQACRTMRASFDKLRVSGKICLGARIERPYIEGPGIDLAVALRENRCLS